LAALFRGLEIDAVEEGSRQARRARQASGAAFDKAYATNEVASHSRERKRAAHDAEANTQYLTRPERQTKLFEIALGEKISTNLSKSCDLSHSESDLRVHTVFRVFAYRQTQLLVHLLCFPKCSCLGARYRYRIVCGALAAKTGQDGCWSGPASSRPDSTYCCGRVGKTPLA
jgi:hypothetical protein